MKYIIALTILSIALLTGCATRKKSLEPQTIYVHDTTTVERYITIRDTIIVTKPAKVSAQVTKKDLKDGFEKSFENGKAKGSINVKKDTVYLDCECDSIELKLKLKEQNIKTLQKRLKVIDTPRPVQYTPWYITALAWVGGVLLAVLILIVLLKKFKVIK